jgi:hypothetical protein
MNQPEQNQEDERRVIIDQLAELSKLPAMTPAGQTATMLEPIVSKEIALSDWLSAARESFLKLSVSVGRQLDIRIN